jgi:hypothetical protein
MNNSFKNAVNKWIASLGSSQESAPESGGGGQAASTAENEGTKKPSASTKPAYDTDV